MLTILLKTSIEIALALLLIYGFIHEKEVIKFEQYVKMVIVVNYRRYKNKKRLETARQHRQFKLINGRKVKAVNSFANGFDVA